MQGLVTALKDSLLPTEQIIQARERVEAWAAQKPADGKVLVSQTEMTKVLEQLESAQIATTKARTSWTAAEQETKNRAEKLKSLLGDSVWPDQLKGMLRSVRDLSLVLGWPLALALALAYVLHSDRAKDRLVILASSIQKVAFPGGFELTLWGEKSGIDQSATFQKFRVDVKSEYDKLAEQRTIKETVSRMLKDTVEPELTRIRKTKTVEYRATVHVHDALFSQAYYQLIDYLPTGGNRGRAWSIRFGMVGRAWRLREDSWNGKIPDLPKSLITDWGMTQEETKVKGRQSMLCCILKAPDGIPVGAFYLDATGPDGFGTEAEMSSLADKIHRAAEDSGLTKSLEEIWAEIQKKAPLVEIYGNRT